MDSVETSERQMPTERNQNSEDEIEFVSEGLLRPVTECVDLLSSDDEARDFSVNTCMKDHVDRHKDQVASTLDRLAREVEEKKQQKAEKNKAFQEKLNLQYAHGLQELDFIKDLPGKHAARMCVDEWMKMPGLKPGNISASRRSFSKSCETSSMKTQPIACPIMNCGRKFDNGQLLLGHLKRFDHSPCDPSIALHGVYNSSYACVLCLERFASISEYNEHLSAKAMLADGHERRIPSLLIQSFACPSCFLLFYQRDECLKHMSVSSHFKRAIVFKDDKRVPCPIPMPTFAKSVLIGLCKDVLFQIVCTSCHLELRSYPELTAHFRSLCRKAGPVSLSEKSIGDVAAMFRLNAYCPYCREALSTDAHIAKHIERNNHNVRLIASIEESILAFCYINEGTKTPSDICLSAANTRLKHCMLKRTLHRSDISSNILQKCKKESKMATITDCHVENELGVLTKAWFCECVQQFPSEKAAEKHILTVNKIFHKCLVCGKLAEDLAVIHLHMSRFHGGAHLSNFRLWCKVCLVELVRIENAMRHVLDCHGGHSFYYEDDILEQPSTSTKANTPRILLEEVPAVPPQSAKGMWQCHICEEMFASEEAVEQHCKSLTIHQFHKYICNTCKKKFHKVETFLRHCQGQHDGDIKMKYFCGLCGDLLFDEENDFLAHYESFHGLDYGFVPDQVQSPFKSPEASSTICARPENHLTCGCLAKYADKAKWKEDAASCLAELFAKGKLWYSCCSCSATDQTFAGISGHFCKVKSGESSSTSFIVKCSICSKSYPDANRAQNHYHDKHCFLDQPCIISPCKSKDEVFKFTASGSCVFKKPLMTEHARTKKLHSRTPGRSLKFSENMPGSPSVTDGIEPMDICTDTALDKTSRISPVVTAPVSENSDLQIQPMDTGVESELPDLEFLQTMTHIVFVDLDNWAQFFTHLPGQLNQGTFVWGFQGGRNNWKPPVNCKIYKYLSNTGCFFLHPCCGNRKDAADFAICLHAGRLDESLPKQMPFTILSGDKGFLELEAQFKKTQRPAHILNPHHLGGDMMCALLNSIAETTQDADEMERSTIELDEEANFEEAIRRSLVEM